MVNVDESKLDKTDRLGLAWCRLNCFEWDEDLLGEKPCDSEVVVRRAMDAIEQIIGDANVSRCWHIFVLGKTEAEWFRWYTVERWQGLPPK